MSKLRIVLNLRQKFLAKKKLSMELVVKLLCPSLRAGNGREKQIGMMNFL